MHVCGCTWAKEADAIGSCSIDEKRSSGSFPIGGCIGGGMSGECVVVWFMNLMG